MASLFEQYEQATSTAAGYVAGSANLLEMTTAGFINARLEDQSPIFIKEKINFNPVESITHFVVCNQKAVIAMKNKVLLWIDLKKPQQPEEIELSRSLGDKNYYHSRIYNMYLDPNGKHLLISLHSSENLGPLDNLYYYNGSHKVYQASKMKGHVISAVGWNFLNSNESTSSNILVGTTKGLIFETELTSADEKFFFQNQSPEQYWKQVFDIGQKNATKITGLEFHRIPSRITEQKYFIIATTPNRLYQFVGNVPTTGEMPILMHIFNNYTDIPERFTEIPGNLDYSKLQFYYPNHRGLPKHFTWLTEPGILYGNISCDGQAGVDSVITESTLILTQEDKDKTKISMQEDKNQKKCPLGIVLTEFHVLVLYPDRMKAICVLNEQLVFEDVFTVMYGPMIDIVKDPVKLTVWAYSEGAIYRYKIVKEERNVWEVFLQQKEYDLAKKYCQDDPSKLDKVYSKQAEDYFNNENYKESAVLYAITHNSFEEVALKFLKFEQESALKVFLQEKLKSLKHHNKTQITMIILWLLEIYLNEMGQKRNALKHSDDKIDKDDEYKTLQMSFQQFLTQSNVKECLTDNKGAVYNLISSHGDEENLIYFTNLMKDFERIIAYNLQHQKYKDALEVLKKQNRTELFYRFSPLLMQVIPKDTVDAWKLRSQKLNPIHLIPTLVQYNVNENFEQVNEAIHYLRFCIEELKNQDPAIHNYLLALYARLQPEMLLSYLENQKEPIVPYDCNYALRLCTELGLDEARVHIYTTMGLYEEAVDLALEREDVELAMKNADKPENDEELKKKLWLKIAKHVVKKQNDITKAMEFLKKCELLKIEDILPFFDNFVTINHFKDDICQSLKEYNQHIESLQEEMEEAAQSAKEIREEIQVLRNKYAMVSAQDKCCICNYPIMTQAFYLFPCQHMFHLDCLVDEAYVYLIPSKKTAVDDIRGQLTSMSSREDANSSASGSTSNNREKLMANLDKIVGSECLYCGDIMIRSIDIPFITAKDYTEVTKEWE
ncbi:vacuolar protein sorting-associated protein 18 homolog [Centruroides vittatus]|uniref:vacuolar protein sorting-associated protein 18 homolog n=1 Tax=Centruroides vittatus TaxID=120091 RepID=UPI0035107544